MSLERSVLHICSAADSTFLHASCKGHAFWHILSVEVSPPASDRQVNFQDLREDDVIGITFIFVGPFYDE